MKSHRFRIFLFFILIAVVATFLTMNFGWHKQLPSSTKKLKSELKEKATTPGSTASPPSSPTNKVELNSKACQSYCASDKRELAKALKGLHEELQTNANHKLAPSKKLLLKLGSIIESLDPRLRQSAERKEKSPSTAPSNNETTLRDICPEVWPATVEEHRKISYPFFHHGFSFTNCTNVKSLASVITVLLNVASGFPSQDTPYIGRVLRGISRFYSTIKIKIAVSESNSAEVEKLASAKDSQVEVVKTTSDTKEGKVWNNLVSGVETPYVLVGRNLAHFSWLARLKRQILVLSEKSDLAVVGGSFRNQTGHWRAGCFQTELKNSVLRYTEGYYTSYEECMYCDYLGGAFVARTSIMKEITLDEQLNHETVFEDWILRLNNKNNLAMSCPDAMYFTGHDYQHKEKPKRVDRNTWLNLARKWTLVRVLLPGNIKHSFSCKDIAYQCTTSTAKYYTHPVCCQEQAAKAMDFFHKLCKRNNIIYEMDTGSNLGLVKMNDFMPWEIDGDFVLKSSNFSFFTKAETQQAFSKAGHPLQSQRLQKPGPKSHGYLDFHTPDFKMESDFWPELSSDQFLPGDIRHIQTLARFHDTWIHSSSSPGLYSRNRYLRGILKHAPHFTFLSMSQSREYNYGTWLPCPDPSSHRCLDKFPGDGNIPFFVP